MTALRAAMAATAKVFMAAGYTGDPDVLRQQLAAASAGADVAASNLVQYADAPAPEPSRGAPSGVEVAAVLDELDWLE